MITQKMQDALNNQINEELFSAYLYYAMSAYFHDINLNGFAQWMKAQATEEIAHAVKLYDHVNDRDGRVELKAIKKPQKEWKSPLAAFQAAYEHECYITGKIHDLVSIAEDEKDRAVRPMLEWFVEEQVEEEASTKEIMDQLKLMGDSNSVMFMLDREMNQRQVTMPTMQPGGDE